LGGVVARSAGAVEIDVVDTRRSEVGDGERLFHRLAGAAAFRVRRGHVVRVARLSAAGEEDAAAADIGRRALEQRERGRLADGDAVARHVERLTRRRGDELQRVKAVERRQAKRIDPADDGGIDPPGLDHAPCGTERLRAGRAGRGDDGGGAFEPEQAAGESAEGVGVVRPGIVEIRRQRARCRIAMAVGDLRRQHAGGARSQDEADALPAPPADAFLHRIPEAVLAQPELREAVVAAVEAFELRWQRLLIHTRHLANIGVEANGLKRAWRESAALSTQRRGGLLDAAADAARGGEMAEEKRSQVEPSPARAERNVMGFRPAAAIPSSRRGSTSSTIGEPDPLRAALPSCSSRMSPPRNWLVSFPSTASALALMVSNPRRVQLASRRLKRFSTGSRNGLRNPAGARKKAGRCPVTIPMVSWARSISAISPRGPRSEK